MATARGGGGGRLRGCGTGPCPGKAVVLVDDVYTSGATAEACTRVLLRAGARSVTILCWARVLPADRDD